jgi:hypothetical protein
MSDSKSGPMANLSYAYFSGFDAAMKASEPALRGASRINLEIAGFLTRRAQEWLALPAKLSQCKTPVDAAREQLQFWQTAAQQYAEGTHRLVKAFGGLSVLPGLNGAFAPNGGSQARDYITVAGAKDPSGQASAKERDRRAA